MFEKHFLVFCNTDENGNVTDGISGVNIIPGKQYDHFFYLRNTEEVDLMKYKVVNGELIENANHGD